MGALVHRVFHEAASTLAAVRRASDTVVLLTAGSERMHYEVDTQRYQPVVFYRVRGDGDREVLKTLLADLVDRFERTEAPLLMLFDFTEVLLFDATLRRLVAAWRGKHRALLQASVQAAAYVITSPLVRGYLTAVNWLRPLGRPTKVFADRASARAWLDEMATTRPGRPR